MDIAVLKLLGFAVVLTRISVFLIVVPIFSSTSIPVRIRVSILLMLSLCFSMAMPTVVKLNTFSITEAVLLITGEAIYGLALGLIVMLIFSAVKIGGRFIEREMGLAMAEMLDPLSGESVQPLSILVEMLFILMFLAANGHHMLLGIIAKSYEAFPAGRIPELSMLVEGVVQAGSVMLVAGLRLAAPMLAAFLLMLTVLGVFARIIPEMDILFISMPLRIGLGLLMVCIFFPFIQQFIGEFSDWMGKLLPM
jgi:flagellar biosynthetic protein FliR